MREMNVYLTFDGNCRQAMEFYKSCFGGELMIVPFSDAPPEMKVPKEAKNRILHSKLTSGSAVLMASDAMPGMDIRKGNNFSVSIECADIKEAEKLFAAVGSGGKVTMPLQETFWAKRFGMLLDKFGIQWMFDVEKEHR